MKKLLILAAGVLATSACTADDHCQPLSADNEILQKADAWLSESVEVLDVVIVEHCGEVVFERYYNEFGPEIPHDMQSGTKTFTGMLAGIAIDQGIIKSIDQPASELLPKQSHLFEGDKADITVRHLLEMTSGLKWVDFGEERSFEKQARAADSAAFIVGEPLVSAPGEEYFYNTGSSHLLSAIIHYNTGMTTSEYADKYLFGPLEFGDYVWNRHGDGVNEGGWQLYIRPVDALKFGRMMLDRGQFNGQQIVSADFVDEGTSFLHASGFGDAGYGFQMWNVPDAGNEDLAGARGWGNQNFLVAADLDAVIVTNGDITRHPETIEVFDRLLKEFLVPALKEAP